MHEARILLGQLDALQLLRDLRRELLDQPQGYQVRYDLSQCEKAIAAVEHRRERVRLEAHETAAKLAGQERVVNLRSLGQLRRYQRIRDAQRLQSSAT